MGGQGGWRKKKKWCVILARCMNGRERRARLFHTMHYIYLLSVTHRPSVLFLTLFVGRTDQKSPQHLDGPLPYRSSSAQLHACVDRYRKFTLWAWWDYLLNAALPAMTSIIKRSNMLFGRENGRPLYEEKTYTLGRQWPAAAEKIIPNFICL